MQNFKISVIVPVYNCAEYIGTSLDSILNQDFDSYEIIVVDDGSSDNSLEIIHEKLDSSQIPHKIIHQENQGVSVARNRGIEESNGDYLVFVDADDYILTNHLSQLYSKDCDFSLIQYVKKDGEFLSNPKLFNLSSMSTDEFIKKELNMDFTLFLWQIMYKKDIIVENNLKFTPGLVYGEDIEFTLKALSCGDEIILNNTVTYYYIQHTNSAISESKFRRFEVVDVFENLKVFFKNQKKDYLANLITTSRIPKAIFGNMNYFFYNGYDFDEVLTKMKELNLLSKLSEFEGNKKFKIKIKLFLLNPKLYYKLWMKFKNSID